MGPCQYLQLRQCFSVAHRVLLWMPSANVWTQRCFNMQVGGSPIENWSSVLHDGFFDPPFPRREVNNRACDQLSWGTPGYTKVKKIFVLFCWLFLFLLQWPLRKSRAVPSSLGGGTPCSLGVPRGVGVEKSTPGNSGGQSRDLQELLRRGDGVRARVMGGGDRRPCLWLLSCGAWGTGQRGLDDSGVTSR